METDGMPQTAVPVIFRHRSTERGSASTLLPLINVTLLRMHGCQPNLTHQERDVNEISIFHGYTCENVVFGRSAPAIVRVPKKGGTIALLGRRCKTRLEGRAIVRHISDDLSAKRGGGNVHRLLTRGLLTLSPIVRSLSI